MKKNVLIRNAILAILGALALVLKPAYRGPFAGVLFAYGGNFAVSFALYFAAVSAAWRYHPSRLVAACGTLLAVEAFEITDGFGVMTNVYDPIDLAANAAGIAFAIIVDVISSRMLSGE